MDLREIPQRISRDRTSLSEGYYVGVVEKVSEILIRAKSTWINLALTVAIFGAGGGT